MASMRNRPFAVFDIDGTLVRWQLFHAMADALAKRNLLNADQFQAIKQQRLKWKKRHHADAFTHYETSLIQWIDERIAGLEQQQLEIVCQDVIDEYIEQTYTFTYNLIHDLRQTGYLLFALSGSPNTLVQSVARYYHFDAAQGSDYDIRDGRLTGTKRLMYGTAKADYLNQLIRQYHASQHGSIGIGDTPGDIPMLSMTERPIAFNPSRELFEHAKTAGWAIVIERKNVIYQLKVQDGQYILA